MKKTITVLAGDGIGPEVTAEAVSVLKLIAEEFGHSFSIESHLIGGDAIQSTGSPLPETTLAAAMQSDAVLLGAVGDPSYNTLPPDNRPEAGLLQLRKAMQTYANLRPVTTYAALLQRSPVKLSATVDMVIVRELTGGLYFGEPRFRSRLETGERVALNTLVYNACEIERVARRAFTLARHRRRKVTSVDKANVLEVSQLWREVVTEVASEFPDVLLEHLYVDNCAMQIVLHPDAFDVILTENLFGDILSDEAAVLTGSLGMLPSASLGDGPGLYEPVHGSAPDIAGRAVANPIGAILSAAMMLRHSLGMYDEAEVVEIAVRETLEQGIVTPDLGGTAGTREVGLKVRERVLAYARRLQHTE